jgi:hypothetical protein
MTRQAEPSAPPDMICGACGRRIISALRYSPAAGLVATCSLHGTFVATVVTDQRTGAVLAVPPDSPTDPTRPR